MFSSKKTAKNFANSDPSFVRLHDLLSSAPQSNGAPGGRVLKGDSSRFFGIVKNGVSSIEREVEGQVIQEVELGSIRSSVSPDVEKIAEKVSQKTGVPSYSLSSSFAYVTNNTSGYANKFGYAMENVSKGAALSGTRNAKMLDRMVPEMRTSVMSSLASFSGLAKKLKERVRVASGIVHDTFLKLSLRASSALSSPMASRMKTAALGVGVSAIVVSGLSHAVGPLLHHVGNLHSSGITDIALSNVPHVDTGKSFTEVGQSLAKYSDVFTVTPEKQSLLSSITADNIQNSIAGHFSGGQHFSTSSPTMLALNHNADSLVNNLHFASEKIPDVHLLKPTDVHAASVAPAPDVHLLVPDAVHAAPVAPAPDVHLLKPAEVHAAHIAPAPDVHLLKPAEVHPAHLTNYSEDGSPLPPLQGTTLHVEPIHHAHHSQHLAHAIHHHAVAHATGDAVSLIQVGSTNVKDFDNLNDLSLTLSQHGYNSLIVDPDGHTRAATIADFIQQAQAKGDDEVLDAFERVRGVNYHTHAQHFASAHEAAANLHTDIGHESNLEARANMHKMTVTDAEGVSGKSVVHGQEVGGGVNMHFVGRGIHQAQDFVQESAKKVENFFGM